MSVAAVADDDDGDDEDGDDDDEDVLAFCICELMHDDEPFCAGIKSTTGVSLPLSACLGSTLSPVTP